MHCPALPAHYLIRVCPAACRLACRLFSTLAFVPDSQYVMAPGCTLEAVPGAEGGGWRYSVLTTFSAGPAKRLTQAMATPDIYARFASTAQVRLHGAHACMHAR